MSMMKCTAAQGNTLREVVLSFGGDAGQANSGDAGTIRTN